MVITEVVANYSTGLEFIWNEIAVLITFESDWEAAKETLREIGERHAAHLSSEAQERVREASKRYMIFYSRLTPTVYTSVRDCGVLLTLRYLIEPRQRRGSEQAVWEEILRAFAARQDIDFAYPTQRFYNNVVEGKPEARARGGD
jgi:small-conductance mechanosensitive channel